MYWNCLLTRVPATETVPLHTHTRQISLENSRFSGNPLIPCVPCRTVFSMPVFSSLAPPQFSAKVSYASLFLLRFLYSAVWISHQQGSKSKFSKRAKVFSLVHILCICLVFSAWWTDDVFANCVNRGQKTRNICLLTVSEHTANSRQLKPNLFANHSLKRDARSTFECKAKQY